VAEGLGRALEACERVLGEGLHDIVLAVEVDVDGAGAEARLLVDVAHRRLGEAVAGEAARGRLEQLAAAGLLVVLADPRHKMNAHSLISGARPVQRVRDVPNIVRTRVR